MAETKDQLSGPSAQVPRLSNIAEVLIDKDCPMCRQFGQSLTTKGFNVTPRTASLNGSIEIRLSDGSVQSGYLALLEISRARHNLPTSMYAALKHPLVVKLAQPLYLFVARNRKRLSRYLKIK